MKTILLGMIFSLTAHATPPSQIPAALTNLEGLSEDSYEIALKGDVPTFQTDVKAIQDNWQLYKAQAKVDGVAESDIATFDASVTTLSRTAAESKIPETLARASNALDGQLDKFYAVYNPVVPVTVMKLDYLGREIKLDATLKDLVGADNHMDQVLSVWAALKPQVVSVGGSTAAADFVKTVADIQVAIDANDAQSVLKGAVNGLEQLDTIEKLFVK